MTSMTWTTDKPTQPHDRSLSVVFLQHIWTFPSIVPDLATEITPGCLRAHGLLLLPPCLRGARRSYPLVIQRKVNIRPLTALMKEALP
jgi:hypothetical protein